MQLCCIFNNLLSSSIKDMSDTKNAFLRYQVLDECFSNTHRKYFLEDLIRICSEKLSEYYGYEVTVSKRTIQYDIEFMMGSGGNFAPIEKCRDGRKNYYRYSDPKYSFMKKDLDAAELAILKDALITMSRIKGLPGFDWMNEMQIQLETALQIDMSKTKIIGFEGNDYLKGIEHLHPLYRSIINQSVLKINYIPLLSKTLKFALYLLTILKNITADGFCWVGIMMKNIYKPWLWIGFLKSQKVRKSIKNHKLILRTILMKWLGSPTGLTKWCRM